VGATGQTYLTVWPTGVARPDSSNLNVRDSNPVANFVIARVGADGSVSIFNEAGNTNVIADVAGWFDDGTTDLPGSVFYPLPPSRIFDTRYIAPAPGDSVFVGDSTRNAIVVGFGGVPGDIFRTPATAFVGNLTATDTRANGYLTLHPGASERPNASNLNFVSGQTVANFAIVRLGNLGTVDIYNYGGKLNAVLDIFGYFGTEPERVDRTPIAPSPVLNPGFIAAGKEGVVSWDAPKSSGGAPITKYRVRRTGGANDRLWEVTATSIYMNDLVAETPYTVTIEAVNSAGISNLVALDPLTPTWTDRITKRAVTLIVRNGGIATVDWTRVKTSGNRFWSTLVNSQLSNAVNPPFGQKTLTFNAPVGTVVNSSIGFPESFRLLFSINFEATTVQAAGVPTRPAGVITSRLLYPGTSDPTPDVKVEWVAPDYDGGSPITGYVIRFNGPSRPDVVVGPTVFDATLTNVAAGSSFTIKATTATAPTTGEERVIPVGV
jgi:Fibronectin type III domain